MVVLGRGLDWTCRPFPTIMTLGFSVTLDIFLLLNGRGLFPTGCSGYLLQVRDLPLLIHLQNPARTEPGLTSFPSQPRWYSGLLALSRSCVLCFSFAKYFQIWLENILKGQNMICLKAGRKVHDTGKQNKACSSNSLEDGGPFWHY